MKKARSYNHIKAGWAVVGGNRIYFRSKFEYNYALKLEILKRAGEITGWLHEPKTFYFEGIKRGTTNYKPDFKVFALDGSHYWVETKGYLDSKSKTKVDRFRRYFPEETLYLVNMK